MRNSRTLVILLAIGLIGAGALAIFIAYQAQLAQQPDDTGAADGICDVGAGNQHCIGLSGGASCNNGGTCQHINQDIDDQDHCTCLGGAANICTNTSGNVGLLCNGFTIGQSGCGGANTSCQLVSTAANGDNTCACNDVTTTTDGGGTDGGGGSCVSAGSCTAPGEVCCSGTEATFDSSCAVTETRCTVPGGSTGGTGGGNDCTGKDCGDGTCFTGPNPNDGGWGCNCNNGSVLGPSLDPGVCPTSGTTGGGSTGGTTGGTPTTGTTTTGTTTTTTGTDTSSTTGDTGSLPDTGIFDTSLNLLLGLFLLIFGVAAVRIWASAQSDNIDE